MWWWRVVRSGDTWSGRTRASRRRYSVHPMRRWDTGMCATFAVSLPFTIETPRVHPWSSFPVTVEPSDALTFTLDMHLPLPHIPFTLRHRHSLHLPRHQLPFAFHHPLPFARGKHVPLSPLCGNVPLTWRDHVAFALGKERALVPWCLSEPWALPLSWISGTVMIGVEPVFGVARWVQVFLPQQVTWRTPHA